ncbi:hypothetical protein PHLH7_03140 [Pseudomonas sp. Ost2]|nr:hypothetical protein PHLH7_03140 [Pseudomonas sp. Ost2]
MSRALLLNVSLYGKAVRGLQGRGKHCVMSIG